MFKGVTIFSAIASVLALSACAPMTWSKTGATQTEFSQARYECMQQSQQQVSGAYVNKFGGGASSQMITNDGLFSSCMNAKGWVLGRNQQAAQPGSPPPISPIKIARDLADKEYDAACAREDVLPYLKKSPCDSSLMTLEHMADASKITAEQKAALSKFRTETLPINMKLNVSFRQYGGTIGANVVASREKAQTLSEQNQLDLYEGKQTWGEYNKRRYELNKQHQQEYIAAVNGK